MQAAAAWSAGGDGGLSSQPAHNNRWIAKHLWAIVPIGAEEAGKEPEPEGWAPRSGPLFTGPASVRKHLAGVALCMKWGHRDLLSRIVEGLKRMGHPEHSAWWPWPLDNTYLCC